MRTLLLTLTTCLFVLPANAKYSGGTGEPNDPYQIATAADLIALGNEPNDYDKHFIMVADIDLSAFDGKEGRPGFNVIGRCYWELPVGLFWSIPWLRGTPFTGVFDGEGHTISHLTVESAWGCTGLFGGLGRGGQVKNLAVVDVNIASSFSNDPEWETVEYSCPVGGLVGDNFSGTVTCCYSTGVVRGTGDSVGGLVGSNAGTVTQCFSTAAVNGNPSVGGLVGTNGGDVTQCCSTGAVSGREFVGGLVGYNVGALTHCYSTGFVSGTTSVGGLVGKTYGSVRVSACFWDTQTSGQSKSVTGIGLTTPEMQDIHTYQDAGWDFVGEIEDGLHEVWQMPQEGGYPVLAIFNGYIPHQLEGHGTSDSPYLIFDEFDLGTLIHYSSSAHYRLAAPIELSGICWGTAVIPRFGGTFDGDNYTISHLTIKGSGYLGLFGRLESGADLSNLGLIDVDIIGTGGYVGGLVGSNGSLNTQGGVITNCCSTGVVRGTGDTVSGLVGSNAGIVTQCYSAGSVSGDYEVGGLVGGNNGSVNQCCSTTVVTGVGSCVGGLIGRNWARVTQSYATGAASGRELVGGLVGDNCGDVTYCYSTGAVAGEGDVGGLVGLNNPNNRPSVSNCYSTGAVSGTRYVGGLVGHGSPEKVLYGIWDIETSGLSGSAGGVGLTTTEMMDPYMLGLNGFSNDPNWVLDAGHDYPRLAWEGKPGNTIPQPAIDWLAGQGTASDPYKIGTADQLILLGKAPILWDKHFSLSADIDLDPALPGRRIFGQALIQSFTGVFDGRGHKVSHLTITGAEYAGLFGRLETGANVAGVGAVDVNVAGIGYVGGLAAYNYGSVTRCYSTGWIKGEYDVGGLAAVNYGDVTQCYSAAAVSGSQCVGGLAAVNDGGVVRESYSTGAVSGSSYVGGLVGQWRGGNLIHCYSIGEVSGATNVGGLVGEKSPYILLGSFWDTQTSGQATSAGGTGKTTAQMQTAGTFLDAGWDFVDETANGTEDIWWIDEGKDSPRLWWEKEAD